MQPHHRPAALATKHKLEDALSSSANALHDQLTLNDEEEEPDEEESLALLETRGGAAAVAEAAVVNPLLHTLKIGFYFGLWYALNIVYNSTLYICRFILLLGCHGRVHFEVYFSSTFGP